MKTSLNYSICIASLCLLAPLSANALEFAGYLRSGVILPHREGIQHTVPGSLKRYADWMRHVVTEIELADHQFPPRIPTHKKPALKPAYW